MPVERREQAIDIEFGSTDVGSNPRREEPNVQWKAAAFARWHEPDGPMRGIEIAEKLGVSHQRVRQLVDQAARTRTGELRGPEEPLLDRDARG